MAQLFLKAKHWQIFMLTFVIPLILGFIITIVLFYNIFSVMRSADSDAITSSLQSYVVWMMSGSLVLNIPLFMWIWSITYGLQKYIPSDIKVSTKYFKSAVFGYFVFELILMVGLYFMMGTLKNPEDISLSLILSLVIMAVSLPAKAAALYSYYVAAKVYATAMAQKQLRTDNFILEIVLIWFNFIGVWMIQPKINRMVNREPESLPRNSTGPADRSQA